MVLQANARTEQAFLSAKWPNTPFPIYAPQALIPQLNAFGKQGWQLVSLQPVVMGENGDMQVIGSPLWSRNDAWSSAYLCAFKRPLLGEE